VDVTPPTVRLSASSPQKLGSSVRVRVTCSNEACRATAGGSVRVPRIGARPSKLYRLTKVTVAIRRAAAATLAPKLPSAAQVAITHALRAHRSVSVQLSVTAADAAQNKRTLTRRVRLKL
jgi:hypothetical protein